jgi:competence protein ComEC
LSFLGEVSGKLYVTLPLLQGTGIYPGENLSIRGILYKPKATNNPGAFNFQEYLASQGAFALLKGLTIITTNRQEPQWGLEKIRSRIVRSQMRWLGSPTGQLVSSMVLGQRAVDLPNDVRDRFIKAGLAHVLAASGFHVSLLLGMVLRLTNSFSSRSQLIIGLITLAIYISLTGLQPSVVRAGLMGTAVLIALVTKSQVSPLGSLLLAATILLLINPLWIWDLGFQLSFLATLGLIVTVPSLSKQLDWLPPTIATAIAIPLAASIWTLPLLIYVFNTVATYSILVNVIATPLVTVISLGGMISAIAALIIPIVGSAIAWLLLSPTWLLNKITELFTNLPGSSLAVGRISLGLLIAIYGLICLIWLSRWWQSRWWVAFSLAIALIVVPISYSHLNLIQVTVLATQPKQIIVIQDKGNVIVINSGDTNTAKYALLPFLAEQGINHIDYAVVFEDNNSGWREIKNHLPIKNFVSYWTVPETQKKVEVNSVLTRKNTFNFEQLQSLATGKTISISSTKLRLVSSQPPLLQLQIQDRQWFILGRALIQTEGNLEKEENYLNFTPEILLWSGENTELQWLENLSPQVAIAVANEVEEDLQKQLQQKQTQLYVTGNHGAIFWKPETGFEPALNRQEQNQLVNF